MICDSDYGLKYINISNLSNMEEFEFHATVQNPDFEIIWIYPK